jgi:hypothetical protein
MCQSADFRHPEFWDKVKTIGVEISLIHETEAEQHGGESDVSERAAVRVRLSIFQLTST